jgi:putative inorganic carbon (HCO3(-)) transporter
MDPGFAVGEAAEKLGVVLAAAAAVAVLVLGDPRWRAFASVCALVVVSVVLVGHIWNTEQFRSISGDAATFTSLLICGLLVISLLALLFLRRPELFPLFAVASLPFRVPIEAAGSTSKLLVPLYLVIAGGTIAHALSQLQSPELPAVKRPVRLLELAIAIFIALYAAQSLYSRDFDAALEQMVFFYVPFVLLFRLLAEVRWTRSRLLGCGAVLLVLALVFCVIGFWEYDRRELFWNPKVIQANEFESYFRVNSVFWDPNVYGRFLVLVMVTVTGLMLWNRRGRLTFGAALVLAVLWGGLVLTFSQSSFAALLVGLAVLAALRWDPRRTAALSVAGVCLGALFLLIFQDALRVDLGSSSGLNRATSGRADLIEGGVDLFLDRPLWGYGSGSFARTFRLERKGNQQQAVSASHTLPVTVSAEQGLVGLAAYLLVLAAAFRLLLGGLGVLARPPPQSFDGALADREGQVYAIARVALAAAFAALVTHTMMYAAFLEDPFTWVILATVLAIVPLARLPQAPGTRVAPAAEPASATA